MKLSNLKPAKGSIKLKKRIGRGQGSGRGGTSTRGHNGAKSRSGYSKKIGFEGGQMPLQRRVPKFGFRNPNRVEYKPVNLDVIEELSKKEKITQIDRVFLIENGLISKKDKVKILARGELTHKLEFSVDSVSKSAEKKIQKAGGKVIIIAKMVEKEDKNKSKKVLESKK